MIVDRMIILIEGKQRWIAKNYIIRMILYIELSCHADFVNFYRCMIYFEDILLNQEFETESYKVSKKEILEFAQKYDPQPFHMSEELAKESLFGELIASGWHTASIFMKLSVDSWLGKVASMGSPGVDELRWKRPVKADDTLKVKSRVIEKKTFRKGIGIITHTAEVLNQDNKIVMTIKGKAMIQCRP